MATLQHWMNKLPWSLVIVAVLTLGLAPFIPEPHVWEKLKLLIAGDLIKPIDWFDLVLHGTPYILLILKLLAQILPPSESR
ncbi:hypothetical protein [Thiofilum flexile]|uniref:hypothetical protein n=1 Tax=Thiofilum flexile TaxID=125627 RepID=UPI00036C3767|nr:hypothetical protein [Thiofilum flexile]